MTESIYNRVHSAYGNENPVPKHSILTGLADDDHTDYSRILTGAGVPASTPTRVGNIYIDTTCGVRWISVGTSSAADWTPTPNTGWAPLATALGSNIKGGVNFGLGDNGKYEAVLLPIHIPCPMLLDSVMTQHSSFVAPSSASRQWVWGIYLQDTNSGDSNENTLRQVARGDGSKLVADASSPIESKLEAYGAPIYLDTGVYWLVIQGISERFEFTYRDSGSPYRDARKKVLPSAIGKTLDFSTGWSDTIPPMVLLVGRVFGETMAF